MTAKVTAYGRDFLAFLCTSAETGVEITRMKRAFLHVHAPWRTTVNEYQIFQAPGYVVILVEMIHDARIIPLDGRPHADQRIRQWLGDSRGRWEGDTLVVETTNFTPVNGRALTVFGANETTRLVERFTRIDDTTIDYQFTVSDPAEYTTPWTASIPMTNLDGLLYEYACHEGNYGLENILAGARAAER